ncbi:MAG TPA: ABC transporter permease [Clostridiaceae bacterium]|jgi:ABC-2 type transport system permease protein|nr:ABC transporter permease [Clostridiaceae bacterium]
MLAIMKRDFRSYFNSPIAYVLIGLYMLLLGLFFNSLISYGISDIISEFVANMSGLLLLIIPILTMRSMAEDKKNGTEVLLLTSPVRVTEIVLGKYFASFCVFLVMTAASLIFPLIVIIAGKPDIMLIISSYLGYILIGAVYISLGVFASSLTENQIIAAIISLVSIFLIQNIGYLASFFSGFLSKAFLWISILDRYLDFNKGIIDLTSIVFMISYAAVFVFLTVRVIERKRWSQG